MGPERFWGVSGVLRRYSVVLKRSWGGPDGSWWVLWGWWVRNATEGLKVSQGVMWRPRVPEGSKGFWEVLKGPTGLWWTFDEISSPLKPLWLLKNPQSPAGPLQSNRIPQDLLDPWTPRNIRTPQNNVRTPSGPLQELWIPPQNSWDPSELFRTHQNPLGSFEPLGIPYYNLLKNNILCYKMLVFNLHVLHSLSNILAYI